MKNTNACYFKFANKKTTNAVLVDVAEQLVNFDCKQLYYNLIIPGFYILDLNIRLKILDFSVFL